MFLNNQRGQMAIFVALFFQVLFVFFAMAINVGLVVHDKINLQNAVDIAAYYGAAKQAEVLNQIGHINYQMRQNYKLFAWRYRVLGTLGNTSHPLSFARPGAPTADADSDAAGIAPSVCVAHPFFKEVRDIDPSGFTMCQRRDTQIINVQPPTVSGGIVPGANELPAVFEFIRDQLALACREASVFNWLFAGRILVHFRVDGAARKRLIRKLANNLSLSDPLDLRNESIREGVDKTFRFNLTDSNSAGIQQFEYFNSLSSGQCADPSFWLPEIAINPVIFFSDHRVVPPALNCEAPKAVPNRQGAGQPPINGQDNLPESFTSEPAFMATLNANQVLADHWRQEPDASTGLNSSIGFEKNPWCMVYSGVQATTVVRKPFDPSGGVTLRARAFAKPFGGRIGPWYGKTWPNGNANSQASDRSQMVDPLLPSRNLSGAGLGSFDPNDDVVNHSRFPGDQFGIASMQALGAMADNFHQTMNFTDNATSLSPVAYGNYDHLGGLPNLQNLGDSLARDNVVRDRNGGSANVTAAHRPFEIAAVAPDVFDALYYSIEPAYHNNYFTPQTTNGGAQFPQSEQLYDFGSSKDNHPGSPRDASVTQQVQQARTRYNNNYPHIIRDWRNLLTSWHQKAAVDYTMDQSKFGRCQAPVSNSSFPTTGNCIAGGRTGYGVKLISRDYLSSGEHALGGGAGGAGGAGPILNPPAF